MAVGDVINGVQGNLSVAKADGLSYKPTKSGLLVFQTFYSQIDVC